MTDMSQTSASLPPLVVPKPDLPHIVIVGGGAGGLELATRLGDKLGKKGWFGKKPAAAITLIDRTRTHVWKPLLHEIAAGSMEVDRHEVEFQAQGHWHGFRYRYGEMIGLDRANKRVHFIDEKNDLTLRVGDFFENRLETFFEFTTIFTAGDECTQVERHQLLVAQAGWNVAVDNTLC